MTEGPGPGSGRQKRREKREGGREGRPLSMRTAPGRLRLGGLLKDDHGTAGGGTKLGADPLAQA
eukprot:7230959-Pyramimonas_sp.AAC.1